MVSNIPSVNADFMRQAYLAQQEGAPQATPQTPAQAVNFTGNPQQKSGLGVGTAIVGGTAAAGAGYYFAKPVKDGIINPKMAEILNKMKPNPYDNFVKAAKQEINPEFIAKAKKGLFKPDFDNINKIGKEFIKNLAEDKKTLAKEAPEYLQKALKNFKLGKALKWGALGAGAIIGLNLIKNLFIGNKQV